MIQLWYRKYKDISGMYEYTHIGDSAIKKEGTLIVRIIRNNVDHSFQIDFNCQ